MWARNIDRKKNKQFFNLKFRELVISVDKIQTYLICRILILFSIILWTWIKPCSHTIEDSWLISMNVGLVKRTKWWIEKGFNFMNNFCHASVLRQILFILTLYAIGIPSWSNWMDLMFFIRWEQHTQSKQFNQCYKQFDKPSENETSAVGMTHTIWYNCFPVYLLSIHYALLRIGNVCTQIAHNKNITL